MRQGLVFICRQGHFLLLAGMTSMLGKKEGAETLGGRDGERGDGN